MSLQAQSVIKKHQSGVTVIELLIVISIIIILGSVTLPLGSSFLERNALRNKTNEISTSLKIAQLNSISGKGDSVWGVNIDSSKITLFKGDSFASRDTAFDRVYSVPDSLSISALEVVFERNTGNPNQTQVVSIQNSFDTKTISLNEVGTVNIQ